MSPTQLLAIEIPFAARLIEMFDGAEAPMHAGDYLSVSTQLRESLALMSTKHLMELVREHSDYGPPDAMPAARRRLPVLGELAANAVFARLGYLPDVSFEVAADVQRQAQSLPARERLSGSKGR